MINFLKKMKIAFVVEQIKVKNKQLILICLLIQLIHTAFIFIATESYTDIINILTGYSFLNEYLILQLQTHLVIFQPLLLVLISYIVVSQIELKNGNSILHNSLIPKQIINYSKMLMIINYVYYSIFILIGSFLILLVYIQINSEKVLNINYETLPNHLLTFLVLPILTLPILALINLISRRKSSFNILFLLFLPLYYFVNINIALYIDRTFYYYFNLQIVVFNLLESITQFDNTTLFWIITLNVTITFFILFYINHINRRRYL